MATREWFTAAEIAAMGLPGMPTSKVNVLALAKRDNWCRPEWVGKRWRRRAQRGGGFEYHWSVLPPDARLTWSASNGVIDADRERASGNANAALWDRYQTQPDGVKEEALRRLQALDMVFEIVRDTRRPKLNALLEVAQAFGVSKAAIYDWERKVKGQPRANWVPLLMPAWKGRTAVADCSEAAFDELYKEYVRPSCPTFAYAYRKISAQAAENNWVMPSEETLRRRMDKIDPKQMAYGRHGAEGVKKVVKPQQRDKEVFRALDAVNADGHLFDVRVKWEDGKIGRPMVVAFQDLYSGKFLSYRVGRTENTNSILLAVGDLIERFGVPQHCYYDNGRAFASKRMTGGAPTRYRFKEQEGDIEGVLTRLNVKVHFTHPYSGRSKPIERGFGDFARDISRDIRFEGCHVGSAPHKKPSNYDTKHSVPVALFRQVLEEGIAEHNAREGRRSAVCGGKLSFNQVFNASYEQNTITKVAPSQKLEWLPEARNILVRGPYGFIEFNRNRYDAEFLLSLMEQRVRIRFDPDKLHDGLHIFTSNGKYLGHAACSEKVGFNSEEAAETTSKMQANARRLAREAHEAARKADDAVQRQQAPRQLPPDLLPETKVVRLFNGNAALQARMQVDPDQEEETQELFSAAMRRARGAQLHLVEDAGDD